MRHRITQSVVAWLLAVNAVCASDRDAITALENAGAQVHRDESKKDKPVVLVTINLRQVNADGIQALSEIEHLPSINFRGTGDTEITPATLRTLQGKRSLKRFSISNAKISDEAAKVLGTLNGLDALDLHSQVELSPRGCDEIFRLTNIKELTLSDRLVSEFVLEDLTRLPSLKILAVRSIFVTDEGLASLKQLRSLKTLRIFIGPRVTDEGLQNLSDLRLSELEITYFNVSNNNLKELRKVSSLKVLRLMNAKAITEDAIPYLAEMTDLKELEIIGGQLTKANVKELKDALPNCKLIQAIQ